MSRNRKLALAIVSIVLVLVVVGVIGVGLLVMSLDSEPEIKDRSVLVLNIEGSLPDYANADALSSRLFGASPRSLASLTEQLRKAKSDKRVGGVLVNIGLVMTGWGKADEIREAIADYRTSGKPIYAFMEYGTDKEFYIATSCERVYVAPIGDLWINGLAAQAMFFRGSLDKLGVYMDMRQIGKYKNAPEQYTRKEMSEGQREATNAILDDLFNRYVEGVARARNKSIDEVRNIIDHAPVTARNAAAMNLIDGAKYREEVEDELKARLNYTEGERLRLVRESQYRRVSPAALGLDKDDSVAVIYASGAIGSGESDDGSFGGEATVGSDTLVKALRDAREDKSIKAIVLRVDSPGGVSYPSDIIWQAVETAKRKKPVVVSMSDLAASGGYYISMNANRIFAQPSTLTGSIGVYAGKPVLKGFYDWIGVSTEYTTRGENAGIFRETEPFTKEESAKFEDGLRKYYYDVFVPKVAEGRKRDREYIDSIGQGRVWTGTQGLERGLVDELGGMERAIASAKQLANIPAERQVRRVVFPAPRTLWQEILGKDSDSDNQSSVRARMEQQAAYNSLPADVRRTLHYANFFSRIRRGEVMTMMPFDLRIE